MNDFHLKPEDKVALLEGVMLRVSHVTIGKTWSRKKSRVVDLRREIIFIFYSFLIVAFLSFIFR